MSDEALEFELRQKAKVKTELLIPYYQMLEHPASAAMSWGGIFFCFTLLFSLIGEPLGEIQSAVVVLFGGLCGHVIAKTYGADRKKRREKLFDSIFDDALRDNGFKEKL